VAKGTYNFILWGLLSLDYTVSNFFIWFKFRNSNNSYPRKAKFKLLQKWKRIWGTHRAKNSGKGAKKLAGSSKTRSINTKIQVIWRLQKIGGLFFLVLIRLVAALFHLASGIKSYLRCFFLMLSQQQNLAISSSELHLPFSDISNCNWAVSGNKS